MNVQRDSLLREKRLNGGLFGILAGLGFALGAFGYDAIMLYSASAEAPFIKFFTGVFILMLIGGLVGWLVARLDSGMASFLIWFLTGLSFVWVVSHVPFEGQSAVVGLIDPQYKGLEIFPFVPSARSRMILLSMVVGSLVAILGALQMFIVERATQASYSGVRWFTLFFAGLLFILPALAADNLINLPLRKSILTVDQLLRDGRRALLQPPSVEEQRKQHLSALRTFGDLIERPYRLGLGDYDPESMSDTRVNLNLDGIWAQCYVIDVSPTFCQLSDDLYLRRLSCLLNGGDSQTCWMQVAQPAASQLANLFGKIDEDTILVVEAQRGNITQVGLQTGSGEQFRCRIRAKSTLTLEECWALSENELTSPVGTPYKIALSQPPTLTPPLSDETSPGSTGLVNPEQTSTPEIYLTDPLLPEARQELPDLLLAPRYNLEVEIDFAKHSFTGQARIVVTNAQQVTLDRLYFRLLPNGRGSYGNGSVTVDNLRLDGIPAESNLSLDSTILEVLLPQTLAPDKLVEVSMDFAGKVPVDFGGDETPYASGIYNLTSNVMALASWYPILSVYNADGWNLDPTSPIGDSVFSEMAFYDVQVVADRDLSLISTGVTLNQQLNGDTTTWTISSGPARDFFMVLSPELHLSSQIISGTRVNSYYLKGDEAGGEMALNVAVDSLRIFNRQFGSYPYSEFDLVQAPMRNALGVEYPGIVLIGTDLYDDPQDPSFVVTVSHEVAHQWWYNMVGNDVFDDPWLDEALATYSPVVYYEQLYGESGSAGLLSVYQARYDGLLKDNLDYPVSESLAFFEGLNEPRAYGGIVYRKGALFLHALRQEIGEVAFFAALQDYYQEFRYRIAKTGDLLAAFESAAGRQLDDLYQKWLYSP